MSHPNIITQFAIATAEACRKVRTPGVALDYVQNGTPTKAILQDVDDQSKTNQKKTEEDLILLDACMLRASTKAVLSEQSDELKFLEGKIAALENMERQNTSRNVSFWIEVFRSAGKDQVLRREGAQSIQQAWRAHKCRQKLRFAILSVTRCPDCNLLTQIPQKHCADPPYFHFVPKFRCAGCHFTITTSLSFWWEKWISRFDALIDKEMGTGENKPDSLETDVIDEEKREHILKTLKLCGILEADRKTAEKLLFSFTSFWKPKHLSAMLLSGISFARGVAFRTGLQVDPLILQTKVKHKSLVSVESEVSKNQSAKEAEEADVAAAADIEKVKNKAKIVKAEAEATLSAALAQRKLALLTKFKALAKRIGIKKVADKNLRSIRWKNLVALVKEQQKQLNDAERLVAAAANGSPETSPPPPPLPPPPQSSDFSVASSSEKFEVGQKVMAGLPDWDEQYPGEIRVVNHDGTYGIIFDVSFLILLIMILIILCLLNNVFLV
jgi:hypothetical protein